MNRQNPDQINPLRTNPLRTWGYPCSYFPDFSTYSTNCKISSNHMGYSLILWISGIALGIEGYCFGHRYGDQKMCDFRGMFQVTRNSDKLHVAILFLDSGFGKASVTAHRYFFNIFQHNHYLHQHHHHHYQYHHHHQTHNIL